MHISSDDGCHQPKRKRAPARSRSLSEKDAAIIKAMLLRGDAQHQIAAFMECNPGRVGEIATGETFAHVAAAAPDDLPPAGHYISAPLSDGISAGIDDLRAAIDRRDLSAAKAAVQSVQKLFLRNHRSG